MRIVLGIGNPGRRYENTRHNIGFTILNNFAELNKLTFTPSKYDYYCTQNKSEDPDFVLVKPSTYVNNSGISAVQALENHAARVSDLLVILDDINLPAGEIRVRPLGGDGGHNGMKSIIYHLNSNEFPRIRVGIGSGFEKGAMADYVLSKFHKDEFEAVKGSVKKSCELINEFINGGTKAMLDFNSKKSGEEEPPEQLPQSNKPTTDS